MSRLKIVGLMLIAIFLILGGFLDSELSGTVVYSQTDDGETCAEIVTDTLQVLGSSCSEIGRDEVCYGHREITATLTDDATGSFEEEGNIINLDDWSSLQTGGVDLQTGNMGAAVMLLGANTPDNTDGLTIMLLGEAELARGDDGVAAGCSITNPGPDNLNIRGGASSDLGIRGRFEVGSTGTAVGRNEAGDWVLISVGDTQGWVFARLTELSCEIPSLPVLDLLATTAPVENLDSFSLRSGDSSECNIAPNGIVVRSQDGHPATMLLNGVELAVNGAGYISTDTDDEMVIRVLDGQIDVNVADQIEVVSADFQLSVPLSEAQADSSLATPLPIDGSSDRLVPALEATLATLIQNNIGLEHCLGTASSTVDYRTGPADHFDIVGQLNAGQEILVLRQILSSEDTGWWQLSNSGWLPQDSLEVTGECSSLPGGRVLRTTVDVTPREENEIPTCGIFWDLDMTNDADDGIEVESSFFLAEGTQVYLEAGRDNGEVALTAEGPNGSIVAEEMEGEGLNIARRFRIEEDGNYELRGYSWGSTESVGLVFGIALCP